MEIIRGRQTLSMDETDLRRMLADYDEVEIDIGTGDGRYVQHVARACSRRFAIGLDACRDGMRDVSRKAPRNALFVVANALTLPPELAGTATHVAINFPWGSLLGALVEADPALLDGLAAIARAPAHMLIRLNDSALAVAGYSLAEGASRVERALRGMGFAVDGIVTLDARSLRAVPTSWARRIAHGGGGEAVEIAASYTPTRPSAGIRAWLRPATAGSR